MSEFNTDNVENSTRRIAEALEKMVAQLEEVNRHLRQLDENIRHSVMMKNE
ncbi:MAG: hypothetical protein AAB519_02455 [Patescibacteria group bacterium]